MKLKVGTAALGLLVSTLARASQGINPEVVSLNQIAGEQVKAKNWEGAERSYRRALSLAEGSEGRPTIARLHENLGTLYETENRYPKAEAELRLTYELLTAEYGEHNWKTALALNRVAEMVCLRGHFADARTLFQRSFDLLHAHDLKRPDSAEVLTNLAATEWLLGNPWRADKLLGEATTLLEGGNKDWQPLLAFTLEIRSRIADQAGDRPTADITAQQQAVSILEQIGDPEGLATGLIVLGQRELKRGEVENAEDRLQRALQLLKVAQEEQSPVGGAVLSTLAQCYHQQGRSDKADSLYQQAIRVDQRVLDPEHPNLLSAMKHYAQFLRETDRKKEAKKLEAYVKQHKPEGGQVNAEAEVVDYRQLLREQKG